MTQETAKHFAQNLLSRIKGAEKVMESADIDYASIQLGKDGNVRIWVCKGMKNTDTMCASFDNYLNYNAVSEGRITIVDCYGNEVA
ncbi:MAG: hypothetical protein IJP92_02780 [Lachnospiraceae bacterium]|nr:hypothetical protein [Lachnospiraceae bacterium]